MVVAGEAMREPQCLVTSVTHSAMCEGPSDPGSWGCNHRDSILKWRSHMDLPVRQSRISEK